MKTTILTLFVAIIAMSGKPLPVQPKKVEVQCQYGQCNYIKKDGYQCKNCCQQYSSYCWSHK